MKEGARTSNVLLGLGVERVEGENVLEDGGQGLVGEASEVANDVDDLAGGVGVCEEALVVQATETIEGGTEARGGSRRLKGIKLSGRYCKDREEWPIRTV